MTEILQSPRCLLAGRRSFLTRAGVAVLSAAAIALLVGSESFAAEHKNKGASGTSDTSILNSELDIEYEGIAAYQVGAESGLLQKPVLDLAKQFQGQRKAHADLLAKTVKKLGGKPAEPKRTAYYEFLVHKLKTQTDVLRFAADLERDAAPTGGARPGPGQRETLRRFRAGCGGCAE